MPWAGKLSSVRRERTTFQFFCDRCNPLVLCLAILLLRLGLVAPGSWLRCAGRVCCTSCLQKRHRARGAVYAVAAFRDCSRWTRWCPVRIRFHEARLGHQRHDGAVSVRLSAVLRPDAIPVRPGTKAHASNHVGSANSASIDRRVSVCRLGLHRSSSLSLPSTSV
jgi:hypothetical protein